MKYHFIPILSSDNVPTLGLLWYSIPFGSLKVPDASEGFEEWVPFITNGKGCQVFIQIAWKIWMIRIILKIHKFESDSPHSGNYVSEISKKVHWLKFFGLYWGAESSSVIECLPGKHWKERKMTILEVLDIEISQEK